MRKHTIAAAFAVVTAVFGFAGPALADGYGDTAINSVVVNGTNRVAVGTTYAKTFTVKVTATDDSGISGADIYVYGPDSYLIPIKDESCTASSATTSTCTATFTVDPRVDFYDNTPAGTWYVDAWVDANDGDFFWSDKAGSFLMQRYSKLTTNATPEPVAKGRTVTVYGKLTRANWETSTYTGYTNQPVKLQFRTKSGTYGTVKTVYTGSGGALKTTVTASVDGCWRWTFAGTATTPAVTSTGDCVDVQ